MTKTKGRNRKPVRQRFYRTVSPRRTRCRDCGRSMPSGETYLFRREGFIVLCLDCGKGVRAKDSERLRTARGEPGWRPNRPETTILLALLDEPLSAPRIAVMVDMHPGKVQGLLGHLRSRKCVDKIDQRYQLTDVGRDFLADDS